MGDKLTPEELAEFREIFNLVDKDGGGTISKEELGELMETLGIDATPDEIDLMLDDEAWTGGGDESDEESDDGEEGEEEESEGEGEEE